MANGQNTNLLGQTAAAFLGGNGAGSALGMLKPAGPVQGQGAGGLFGLYSDESSKSGANAFGGGGFDGSGWSVNIGSGSQSAASTPTTYGPSWAGIGTPNADAASVPRNVGFGASQYGLPVNYTAPIGAQPSAGMGVSPLLLMVGAVVLVVAIKKGKK